MTRNNFAAQIAGFFGDIGRARDAENLYLGLARMSDTELAARGLARDGLANYAIDKAFKK